MSSKLFTADNSASFAPDNSVPFVPDSTSSIVDNSVINSQPLILASSSPRRYELLMQLGLRFTICNPNIDESFVDVGANKIEKYSLRMATEKAYAGYNINKGLIIAADTIGEINGQILSKPLDYTDAKQMLSKLSNATHKIHTAFAIYDGNKMVSELVTSSVTMREITESEIAAYWQSGEPQDKAGAYAIQGLGAIFIKTLSGSYSAVMGLPLFELAIKLQQFGIKCLLN